MHRNRQPRGKINTPENKAAFLRLMKILFNESKIKFVAIILLVSIGSVVSVAQSIFIKTLVDDYITPMLNTRAPDYSPLIRLILLYAFIFLMGTFSTLSASRLMINIAEKIIRDLRNSMFEHMEKLPISFFDQNSHGNLMSRYTSDTQVLEQMLTNALPNFFSSLLTLIVIITAMILSSAMLFLVVVVCIVLLFLSMNFVGGKSSVFFTRQQDSIGKANGYIEELIEGQKVVKVFSREDKVIEDFKILNEELTENTMLANRYSLYLLPIIFNIGNLQFAFIATVGGLMTLSGNYGLTIGGLVGFLQLSRSFSGPINNISQQMNQVILALAGAKRIFDLLDQEIETDDGIYELVRVCEGENGLEMCSERTGRWAWKNCEDNSPFIEVKGDIRFYNVDFSYDGENKILEDISLYAKPGQKIAFVGETGAGKTTITNLINRFYEIDSGKITFDGIDIREIKKPHLRSALGMVLQDTHLFTGTVNYNLKYGRPETSDQEVIEASKKTQSDDFIEKLEDRYDTVISGTNDLSQGQAQLLSIGRAEIYNPPVLILDEATSSIDTRTEHLVQESMDEIMKGRTTFVIAHRLSTVKNADAIIVLSHGKIIERGNHEELMALKGSYYKLYTGGLEELEK
ncbi:ABC transporter ATP-binding protein [Peptoniphilus asaccharolyticus]